MTGQGDATISASAFNKAKVSFRRLRVRIILLFVLLGLMIAAVFMLGSRFAFTTSWRDLTRPLVSDYVDRLVSDMGSPPSIERARALTLRLPLSVSIRGPVTNWASDPPPHHGPPRHGEARGDRFDDEPSPMLSRLTADGHQVAFGLNFAAVEHRPKAVLWLSILVIVLLIGAAYGYVRRLLLPVDEIRAGALRFGQGHFAEPIPIRRQDELGSLARDVNVMAKAIQDMLDAKRALLLAMSHELRSPLTRAKINTELLPELDENRVYKNALMEDLNQMRDLIHDLLESEQLGTGHKALFLESIDLKSLIEEHLLAQGLEDRVQFSCDGPVPGLMLDRVRVRLLLRNLVENALRHGEGESLKKPRVHLGITKDQKVILSVRDFGPGVKESDLPSLAEPFFRTDSSRTRATGGVGLGLYLSRLVAQAHGAGWKITNASPGLEISIIFASAGLLR